MGELVGRAALITGGTTGLGLAIASVFVREGASVAVTGRDEALGRRAQAGLEQLGAERSGLARFLRADAGDPDQIDDSVEDAIDLFGSLDVLVNNAGVGVMATALETPLADFDRVMDVNVRGYLRYAQRCFPHLQTRRGSMIHVGSDAGVLGEETIGAYSVSKAAVHMLSNVLAVEGGRRGVRSNVIAPGDVAPGMRHMGAPGDHDRAEDDDPEHWPVPPVGRVGRADDVAEAALYLASDRASFVNGAVLVVDGGMRAGFNAARWPADRSVDPRRQAPPPD
jgi:NAD(P)-dependent dehydrogenase (short-subunit alcohol dehydrogenase family)